jgi:hypothetical protein
VRVSAKLKSNIFIRKRKTLSKLSKTNTKQFWKYIKKYKTKSSNANHDVSSHDFVEHFSNMSNTQHENVFNPGHFF